MLAAPNTLPTAHTRPRCHLSLHLFSMGGNFQGPQGHLCLTIKEKPVPTQGQLLDGLVICCQNTSISLYVSALMAKKVRRITYNNYSTLLSREQG